MMIITDLEVIRNDCPRLHTVVTVNHGDAEQSILSFGMFGNARIEDRSKIIAKCNLTFIKNNAYFVPDKDMYTTTLISLGDSMDKVLRTLDDWGVDWVWWNEL